MEDYLLRVCFMFHENDKRFLIPTTLGYGAGGRLGIGGTDSVSTPMLVESLQHVFVKKVAVNSGGKHCLALTGNTTTTNLTLNFDLHP